MAELTKITRNGQITLPAPIRKKLGLAEGDYVEISVVDDRAVLVPQKMIDKSQSYFWTEEWQKAEQEADADIKAGRVKTFDTIDELFADLDKPSSK